MSDYKFLWAKKPRGENSDKWLPLTVHMMMLPAHAGMTPEVNRSLTPTGCMFPAHAEITLFQKCNKKFVVSMGEFDMSQNALCI